MSDPKQPEPRGPVTSSDPAKAARLDQESRIDAMVFGAPTLNRCPLCNRVGSHSEPAPPSKPRD